MRNYTCVDSKTTLKSKTLRERNAAENSPNKKEENKSSSWAVDTYFTCQK
jgi:hypothetical protein